MINSFLLAGIISIDKVELWLSNEQTRLKHITEFVEADASIYYKN